MNPYILPEGNVQIAFSGGRTSAYMLHQIIEANGGLPSRVEVLFQNTGREMPETLDFVAEVGRRWDVQITWLEYIPASPRFQVVNHNSAARNGEPFEAMVRYFRAVPSNTGRFCTRELKIRCGNRYLCSLGWSVWTKAVGIRADEPKRIKPDHFKDGRGFVWQPLAKAGVAKADVLKFWERQPFDLRLPVVNGNSALGNCDGCFLKSEATLSMLARDYPERHAWWERLEALATSIEKVPNAGRFRMEYTRAELRDFVERQGDWIFDTKGALCQADDGECMA